LKWLTEDGQLEIKLSGTNQIKLI